MICYFVLSNWFGIISTQLSENYSLISYVYYVLPIVIFKLCCNSSAYNRFGPSEGSM